MHKPDDWLRALHVNVSAPFALTQACLPLLTRAATAPSVFVLDDPELLPRAHWGAYGASKAALERMAAILHAGKRSRQHARACGAAGADAHGACGDGLFRRGHPAAAAAGCDRRRRRSICSARRRAARGAVLDLREPPEQLAAGPRGAVRSLTQGV